MADHCPNAIAKLSMGTGVPVNSLMKIRQGAAPKRSYHRVTLAKFLGCEEDQLFPPSSDDGDAA